MAFEHREMSGTLFRNDKREKENQPHARGEALIDGVLYQISAWTKEGSKGKFQSLSFQRKEQSQPVKQPAARQDPKELDDEIPF